MMPSNARDAPPEKIAITMSESEVDQSTGAYSPLSRMRLLARIAACVEYLEDLEMIRKPMSPQTAVRYDRLLEDLCALVDELARRA